MEILTLYRPHAEYACETHFQADSFRVECAGSIIVIVAVGGKHDGMRVYPGMFPFTIEQTMKIGFTGTGRGMTEAQRQTLFKVLPPNTEVHHGDCVGSDAQCHQIARAYKCRIVIHPHSFGSYKKASCDYDEVRPEVHFLKRNNDIADETSWLIATPKSNYEEIRSGTWSTVRRARKKNRKITIIWPDGTIKEE